MSNEPWKVGDKVGVTTRRRGISGPLVIESIDARVIRLNDGSRWTCRKMPGPAGKAGHDWEQLAPWTRDLAKQQERQSHGSS